MQSYRLQQPVLRTENFCPGCELLSKILSLTIEHNWKWTDGFLARVVNCFQKSYLWLLNTTCPHLLLYLLGLWIAFKNLIFDYWTQLDVLTPLIVPRCELLSKILSLTIEHNDVFCDMYYKKVVNCFQKSYLWLLNTTDCLGIIPQCKLWIAFKNLIFDYWTQHTHNRTREDASCELLSKILSLTIEHNIGRLAITLLLVVNCFQKSYLWLLNTTNNEKSSYYF